MCLKYFDFDIERLTDQAKEIQEFIDLIHVAKSL